MSRTTIREIIKITSELAKMDTRAKLEVLRYLQENIELPVPAVKGKERTE